MENECVRAIRILRAEMSKKGITQKDLEQKLGIKQSQLSRYLSEDVEPGLNTLSDMAGALGLELWEVLKPLKNDMSPAHNELIRKIRGIDESAAQSLIPLVDRMIEAAPNQSKARPTGGK